MNILETRWDQADVEAHTAALRLRADALENTLRDAGKPVPKRPEAVPDDAVLTCDHLECHVAQLRAACSVAGVKAPAGTPAAQPKGEASTDQPKADDRKLTTTEKCMLAKGMKLEAESAAPALTGLSARIMAMKGGAE